MLLSPVYILSSGVLGFLFVYSFNKNIVLIPLFSIDLCIVFGNLQYFSFLFFCLISILFYEDVK